MSGQSFGKSNHLEGVLFKLYLSKKEKSFVQIVQNNVLQKADTCGLKTLENIKFSFKIKFVLALFLLVGPFSLCISCPIMQCSNSLLTSGEFES